MSDIAIRAVNLSKAYEIRSGANGQIQRTLQEDILDFVRNPIGGRSGAGRDTVWALKDVSFEVRHGEVVGIIGRNGAGKSTLLKVLSRITDPTSGYADLYGRVGSLLEVGTGFHSELTGRENIYLSGAVLGMTRSEIRRKFDEIVEFAGVEGFLDTPVKRFSSGMRVRLAFSVAAHLEPEILLVDEVLAVGDAEFQKRSLGKMDEVAKGGRTVLFVSHNMGYIQNLCPRAILFDQGSIAKMGETKEVVQYYLSTVERAERNQHRLDALPRRGNLGKSVRISRCNLLNSQGKEANHLLFGEPFIVEIEMRANRESNGLNIVLGFEHPLMGRIVSAQSQDVDAYFSISADRPSSVRVFFNDLVFTPGEYWLDLEIKSRGEVLDRLMRIVMFHVEEAFVDGFRPYLAKKGVLFVRPRWD